ncbi:MAG: ankyrin repeat domain-containing protein [Mucispirillum sp.]|uniref:Ankyrin repeat domain-containing protein n=1 Tax=Candidatus Mucispirillum faecigallinarum TaxID=2838699 RepID=A0A9D2KBG5_9BACT|nr:ankyrin repeat domain-containing protein [Mucispirillum sp.]HIZ89091.1 ankyrin repeat domain-containing protein [Candidatus Mucispirillum faecigallinarum]
MYKIVLIYLISTLLLITGCNKSKEMQENTSVSSNNQSVSSDNIFQNDFLAEDGSVIQNAAVPASDGEGMEVVKSVNSSDNISANTKKNIQIFFRAVYDNNTAVMENLLKDGFDINTMNENGENAVNVAIAAGSFNVLKYLIDKGANLNSTSDTGIPPLSQAIIEYNKQAIDMLLASKKIDMYYVWGDMWTGSPLYIACSKANIYALEKMVENGADLNYDFSEYNAVPLLHYTINYKQYIRNEDYKELIAFLILNKIDINKKNSDGQTPLMTALKNGDIDTFNALIAGGADVTLKDNNGLTALNYAEHLKGAALLPKEEYEKILNVLSVQEVK